MFVMLVFGVGLGALMLAWLIFGLGLGASGSDSDVFLFGCW